MKKLLSLFSLVLIAGMTSYAQTGEATIIRKTNLPVGAGISGTTAYLQNTGIPLSAGTSGTTSEIKSTGIPLSGGVSGTTSEIRNTGIPLSSGPSGTTSDSRNIPLSGGVSGTTNFTALNIPLGSGPSGTTSAMYSYEMIDLKTGESYMSAPTAADLNPGIVIAYELSGGVLPVIISVLR